MTFVNSKHKTDPGAMHDLEGQVPGMGGWESFLCSCFNVKIPSDADTPRTFLDLQQG